VTRAELLRKIRKCLNVARDPGADENTAAIALAKARELIEAHGVGDEEIALMDVEEANARGRRTRSPSLWEASLIAVVRRALGCHAHGDGFGDWIFVGTGPTAEIASYAFTTLRRQLERARADYIRRQLRRCSPARKRLRADHFCEGWAAAVFEKVATLRPRQELPVSIGAYLAVRHPGLVRIDPREAKTTRQSDHGDWVRGALRGSAVDLNAGVGSAVAAPVHIGCSE
jgi:hypothetical protein